MTTETGTRETCRAHIGWYSPGNGVHERLCGQSVGLSHVVAPDGTRLGFCSREGHRGRVERMAKRVHGVVAPERCECHSYLRADGTCSNAGCHRWGGPFA